MRTPKMVYIGLNSVPGDRLLKRAFWIRKEIRKFQHGQGGLH